MKTYTVFIDSRADEGSFLGPYASREGAIRGLKEWVTARYGVDRLQETLEKFGSDLEAGRFYSEEKITYLVKRNLLP